MEKKTYCWGGRSYPVSAQVVGEEVERIHARDGACPPDALVDAARPPDHVLHPVFDWDNDVAGERWRRHQARNLINAVRLTVVQENGEAQSPAFVSITHSPSVTPGYQPVRVVMGDGVMADEALRDVLSRIRALRQRYADLSALAGVWREVDRVLENVDETHMSTV